MSEHAPKTIRVVTALVAVDGRYLITQRRETAVLPLLWEFPGGRVEPGEKDADALRREMRERLSVEVEVGKLIHYKPHPYEHYTVDLYLYECKLLSTAMKSQGVRDFRWVTSAEFDQYAFTPPDQTSMNLLLGEA